MHASVSRLRFAALSIILNVEISIPPACSNEHVINRAARNGPGNPDLATGLSNRGASHRDAEPGTAEPPLFIRQLAKNPTQAQLPGDQLNAQIQNLVDAIASTQKALVDIRRDDGRLKNESVAAEATDAENWANYTQTQAESAEKDENKALLSQNFIATGCDRFGIGVWGGDRGIVEADCENRAPQSTSGRVDEES